jgi:hypothetical protein
VERGAWSVERGAGFLQANKGNQKNEEIARFVAYDLGFSDFHFLLKMGIVNGRA